MDPQELIKLLTKTLKVHPNAKAIEARTSDGTKSNHISVRVRKGVILIEGGEA